MSSNQQPRPFFRLGSFRPMQNTPQPPPPPPPVAQPSIIRPAVPRFRTAVAQATTIQETMPTPTPPARLIGPPAPPPPTVEQPRAAAPTPTPTPTLAVPRFRTPATQATPPQVQETTATPPARQIGPPAPPPTVEQPQAPVTPATPIPRFRTPATQTTPPREIAPVAETKPIVSQPQASLTNPALDSSPATLPTPVVSTPSSSLPSIVPPAPPTVSAPLLPNLATSKPVSPQPRPRFVASSIPSSPTTKTETVKPSSPQQAAVAAAMLRAPPTQPNLAASKPASPQPRFVASSTPSSPTTKIETVKPSSPPPHVPTDKSPIGNATPQTITSGTYASPARESSALENSSVKKPYPEPSTSPVRKMPLPSPEPKTLSGSRSPPSETLPTAGATTPRNGKTLSKTPLQSPAIRPLSRPPSPLTLPPAQIKTTINHEPTTIPKDQTITTAHKRNGKPKATPRLTDTYEFVETTYKYIGQDGEGKDIHKKSTETAQSSMNVIRLAGENHGAIMELTPSRATENVNGRKTGPHYAKSNAEESSNAENNKSMANQAPPLTAFMNSNVQGLNNSIVFDTSYTHNDPGVHLSFSRKPNGGYVKNHIMD